MGRKDKCMEASFKDNTVFGLGRDVRFQVLFLDQALDW